MTVRRFVFHFSLLVGPRQLIKLQVQRNRSISLCKQDHLSGATFDKQANPPDGKNGVSKPRDVGALCHVRQ